MFKRLPRSDPWFSGVIWQVVSESSYEVLLANMGPAKDKHGVRESFAKVKCLFAKNGRSGIKEFWSTTIYIYIHIYIYLYIFIYLFIYNMILALVAGQYDNRSSESSESTEAQDPSEISLPRFFWKWKALKCGQTTSTQWMFVCIYIYISHVRMFWTMFNSVQASPFRSMGRHWRMVKIWVKILANIPCSRRHRVWAPNPQQPNCGEHAKTLSERKQHPKKDPKT